MLDNHVIMDRKWSPARSATGGVSTGIPTPKVGTNTLEKKNKALSKATKELEDKVKNLQQKASTRTLPNNPSDPSSKIPKSVPEAAPRLLSATRSLDMSRGGSGSSRLLRELPSTPTSRENLRSSVEPEETRGGKGGSTVTSRIREREAEFQRQVVERDDQIKKLKERLKVLSGKEGFTDCNWNILFGGSGILFTSVCPYIPVFKSMYFLLL